MDITIASATLLLTAALVVVTWRYAKSTEVIAHETMNASVAARTTAQSTLLQSLLAVQPVLEIGNLHVDYWRDEDLPNEAKGIPFYIRCAVTNAGSGTAFNPSVTVRIGQVDLPASGSSEDVSQIMAGQTVKISHQSNRATWTELAEYIGSAAISQGALCVTCRDAYGAEIELRAAFDIDMTSTRITRVERLYEGGEDLRLMLRRVLDVLRGDVADI
jgi:hypothetical protein